MAAPLRVLVAGGGTGGHLFPGIAVARELLGRHPAATVVFAGTARGLEARVVPAQGFELELIRSAGLVGKSAVALARGVGLLPLSVLDAWRVVKRTRPDVVVGVGGYSSGPVVLIAAIRGLPTLVLEQNAIPGLTNRLLARVVSAAAVSYEATLPYFETRGFHSGNPVRPGFFAAPAVRADRQPVPVLVIGGSQGAHAINVAMAAAAPVLARSATVEVTHQTGERDLGMVRAAYGRAGLAARVEPFLDAMEDEMAAAELLVCRAGATTLAELVAAGRPAILIPYPAAAHDHQRRNAAVLAAAGAAVVCEQTGVSGESLARELLALAAAGERRARMGAAARRFARPDAARVIVDRIETLARRRA